MLLQKSVKCCILEKNMDIEHMTHRGYKLSLIIAIVLSAMVVTLASLVGRGTLNLSGALVLNEPHDTTVIALIEPKLATNEKISEIDFLRKEPVKGQSDASGSVIDPKSMQYSYTVRTSDGSDYLIQLIFDTDTRQWITRTFERLHGGNSAPVAAQNQ